MKNMLTDFTTASELIPDSDTEPDFVDLARTYQTRLIRDYINMRIKEKGSKVVVLEAIEEQIGGPIPEEFDIYQRYKGLVESGDYAALNQDHEDLEERLKKEEFCLKPEEESMLSLTRLAMMTLSRQAQQEQEHDYAM